MLGGVFYGFDEVVAYLQYVGEPFGDACSDGCVGVFHVLLKYFEVCVVGSHEVFDVASDGVVVVLVHGWLYVGGILIGSVGAEVCCGDIKPWQQPQHGGYEIGAFGFAGRIGSGAVFVAESYEG